MIAKHRTRIAAAMGLVTNTLKSLREMDNVLLKFDSAIGPKIMASNIGGKGKSPFSMT